MDILSAILACSLYRDDALVRAIAETNSHGNPYAVVDATMAAQSDTPRPEPRSLASALELMKTIASLGGEPLVGIMQIPASWAPIYSKRPQDLFDPCTNVAVATAKLSDLNYQCRRGDEPAARKRTRFPPRLTENLEQHRPCVIHGYASAIRMPEFELVVQLELAHQRKSDSRGSRSWAAPILFEAARSGSSSDHDRLLFEVPADEPTLIDPFATDATVQRGAP